MLRSVRFNLSASKMGAWQGSPLPLNRLLHELHHDVTGQPLDDTIHMWNCASIAVKFVIAAYRCIINRDSTSPPCTLTFHPYAMKGLGTNSTTLSVGSAA